MRIAPRVALAVSTACLFIPGAASGAPPANDNYLQSTRVVENGVWPRAEEIADAVNTTEATAQPDLFNPAVNGGPGAGGGVEPTTCRTDRGENVRFGKTVWYDVSANQPGVVAIRATGFDSVVSVYTFDTQTGALRDFVGCVNSPGLEEQAFPPIARGQSYTIQIGGLDTGAGPASGALQSSFEFFPDRDQDEVYDEIDKCDRQKGVEAAGGCPPRLRAIPAMSWDVLTNGRTRIVRLAAGSVRRGDKVQARCSGGCSLSQTRTAKRAGILALTRFVGKTLPAGARIELRVTHAKDNKPGSTYRFGAIGSYTRWDIRAGRRPKRTDRCLAPGSSKPRKSCRR
jgi:hypothetical protein